MALTEIPAPPFMEEARARAFAELLEDAGADSVRMALIAYNQKSLSPEHWDELREKQRQYSAIVRGFLTQMRDAGETADLNPTLSTFALFGMIQSAYLWYDPKGEVKPDELREMFTRIFTGGILLDEAESKEDHRRRLAR